MRTPRSAAFTLCVLALVATTTARAEDEAPPIGLRFDAGWSPRRLFSLGTTGADVGLAAGAQPTRHAAFWGTARLFVGTTEDGLSIWAARPSAEAELVVDRLRFGGGLGLMFMGVRRAARHETLIGWGPEARACARFDFARTDDLAFFLRTALDGGYEIYNGTFFWGPSLGIGAELDFASTSTRSRRTGWAAAAAP